MSIFLWAGTDKVSGGKYKIKWSTVCQPLVLDGFGILDLGKFARVLRLRWPWLECTSPERTWLGSGNPCDSSDMDLFHALRIVTVGDGQGELLELVLGEGIGAVGHCFDISKKKNCSVKVALVGDAWVRIVDLSNGLSLEHLHEFIDLRSYTSRVQLIDNQPDSHVWKLTLSGCYSSASAYKAKKIGSATTNFKSTVWKVWAPPKCKFFTWLIIQNRV